ncbi:unnamed protein product [Discula destructiva]
MARRRVGIVLVAATVALLCTVYFYHGNAKQTAVHITTATTSEAAESAAGRDGSDDLFSTSPVNLELKAVCIRAQWNEGLVFTCDKSFGGIGNIRNSILLCVRFAIQAGAALVLPRIVVRDDDIANYKTSKSTDFGYMFDSAHFTESMHKSCPPMRIYATLEEAVQARGFTGDTDQLHLEPDALTGDGLVQPEAWRDKFYEWLAGQAVPLVEPEGDTRQTVIVNVDRCYMSYPIYSDGEGFAHSFSSILSPRKDLRALASGVIRGLAQKFSLPPTLDLSLPVLPDAFFGAHLRIERDAAMTWAVENGWTHATYEAQAADYLAQAESGRSSPRGGGGGIYAASGDAEGTKRFAADAAARNWTVVDKFDILGSEEADALRALRWDQQAIVDYLVLLKASDFAGVAHSSFSWSVALKRHLAAKMTEGYLNAPERLHDDLSVVYGPTGAEQFTEALWP